MGHEGPAYGLWGMVLINSALFTIFAFSFFKPNTKRDWRTFSAFSAFLVALFVEMYGFPLTIFLLSGWLQSKFPGVDFFGHESGHLWHTLLGLEGNPHFHPVHILSNVVVVAGFVLLSSSWKVLYAAQKEGRLACTGTYARVRHPQYIAFVVIMLGFLIQWPTLVTLAMFPVLLFMYTRLSMVEENESERAFGDQWRAYAARTPRFIPRLGKATQTGGKAEASG